jgi:hypothetical protein
MFPSVSRTIPRGAFNCALVCEAAISRVTLRPVPRNRGDRAIRRDSANPVVPEVGDIQVTEKSKEPFSCNNPRQVKIRIDRGWNHDRLPVLAARTKSPARRGVDGAPARRIPAQPLYASGFGNLALIEKGTT